jgi:hypothetical protein
MVRKKGEKWLEMLEKRDNYSYFSFKKIEFKTTTFASID